MKRWDLLNMAPVVRLERGWPLSHRWVRILPLICSVQMPPKRRATAGVAQARQKAKRGRASSIAASGPALPDPPPHLCQRQSSTTLPTGSWIGLRSAWPYGWCLPRHSHLHLQQYYPTWQPRHHWGLQSRTQWSVHPWQVSYHQPRGQCQRCRPGQRPTCNTHLIVWLRRFWRRSSMPYR